MGVEMLGRCRGSGGSWGELYPNLTPLWLGGLAQPLLMQQMGTLSSLVTLLSLTTDEGDGS